MDVEIADDSFHVSFGMIGQLGRDLIWHWSQHSHSDTHQSGLLREGFPYLHTAGLGATADGAMINQRCHGCVEIVDDFLHVSFGIIRQLGKDLPHHWTQQNHSDSPIWTCERGLPLQLAWGLQDGAMINQRFHGCGDC